MRRVKELAFVYLCLGALGLGACSSERIAVETPRYVKRSELKLEHCEAEKFGLNGSTLQKCDSVLEKIVLQDKKVPGAVVCVVKEDKII